MTKTTSLNSKNLLLIVPHMQVFIKDQTAMVEQYFRSVTALMPVPYFSSIAMRLPIINRNYRFLQYAAGSQNELGQQFRLLSPKFFTLPFETIRKRICYLITRSCMKAVSADSTHFDLVHAHFMENGFVGAALKNTYNIPFVLTAHGGDVYYVPFRNKWYNALAKYVLNEADQVITVSQSNMRKLLSLGVSLTSCM